MSAAPDVLLSFQVSEATDSNCKCSRAAGGVACAPLTQESLPRYFEQRLQEGAGGCCSWSKSDPAVPEGLPLSGDTGLQLLLGELKQCTVRRYSINPHQQCREEQALGPEQG